MDIREPNGAADKPWGIMVSIYCLAYNHEAFIRDTLEGIVQQKTDFPFEVVVHDDASTDRTAEIIREYARKYPERIKPIYQTVNQYSQGVDVVRKFVIPNLRGKYVAVCEGDDYWTDPEKLQRQVDVLEREPSYAACVHQTLEINWQNRKERLLSPYRKDGSVDMKTILSGGNKAFQLSSLMFRRELFEMPLPRFLWEVNGSGDYAFSIFLGLSGGIYYINRTMSVYRLKSSGDSWTSRMAKDQSAWLAHCRQMIQMLKEIDVYSEKRFHREVVHEIQKFQYQLKWSKCERTVFLSPQYREFWKKEPPLTKIKFVLKCAMPRYLRESWMERKKERKS